MSSADTAKKIWTILDLMNWGTGYLAARHFHDARLNIELLLSHVLKLKRIQLYTKFDQPLSETELAHFKEKLQRRLSHEPLQYILGETEFMGLPFSVDRRVLIPRPETELLVEKASDILSSSYSPQQEIFIMDIGTGSGCIAVSMAHRLPNAHITAVDVDRGALDVAAKNAEKNGVAQKISFVAADIVSLKAMNDRFHCILSNPPYISQKEYALTAPEVRLHEPPTALTDNANGLNYYPIIAQYAKQSLQSGGIVGVEHAYDQSSTVQSIFTELGFILKENVKDYQGFSRHLFFTLPS